MRCAILELEANLETFPVWFIFGGRLPQTRGVFSTVLLKSVAVCLYACRPLVIKAPIPWHKLLSLESMRSGWAGRSLPAAFQI